MVRWLARECSATDPPLSSSAPSEKQSLSKARLAVLLKTSRSQVDRLLDPTRDVTLSTLQRAAALVGRKVQIELV
jgi:plasmid maintenance system antidote protein VapI